MFRSLAIVESQSLAVYAAECTLMIIGSLAAGVARHLYVCTAALDVMLAIIAPTDQGGDIANEAVITFFFLQPFRLLLNRYRCEAPSDNRVQIVPYHGDEQSLGVGCEFVSHSDCFAG